MSSNQKKLIKLLTNKDKQIKDIISIIADKYYKNKDDSKNLDNLDKLTKCIENSIKFNKLNTIK